MKENNINTNAKHGYYNSNKWHANNESSLFAKQFYEQIESIHLQLKENLELNYSKNLNINDLSISIINELLFVLISLKSNTRWKLPAFDKIQNKITLLDFINFLTPNTNVHENDILRRFTESQNKILYKLHLHSEVLVKLIRILNSYNFDFYTKKGPKTNNVINNQILCNLYEYLANKSVEALEKSEGGIFYTQKEEIKLMCKLALGDNLINKMGTEHQDLIYDLIFNDNREENLHIIKKNKLASKILKQLETITIIDPSCGSGSFLIEMLFLLTDIIEILTDQDRKKIIYKVIKNNLYGIDVKEWASEACIYHLWLIWMQTPCINNDTGNTINDLQSNIICSDSLLDNWDDIIPKMHSNRKGFDIIISNPPYIRHENITKPTIKVSNKTKTNNKEYKKVLIEKITGLYPGFFNTLKGKDQIKFDAKSDLYIYFYFISLFNLNKDGSLCFITSNSWLDVDFGISLQSLILDKFNLKLLIDNNNYRSFKSADINTVITLISNDTTNNNTEKESLFLTMNKHFEESNFQNILKEIHQLKAYSKNEIYSLLPIKQSILKYKNNNNKPKWGSKYLRAPEIYRVIKDKFNSKLTPLNSVCKVNFGIKSGANKFFYLTNEDIKQWKIEPEFLKPFLYSFKEIHKLKVEENKLNKSLFICNLSKQELIDRGYNNALKYINWGENQNYHLRPSIKKRTNWYTLPKQCDIHFVSNRFLGERFGFPTIENIPVCDVFFVGEFKKVDPVLGCALQNSTLSYLFAEIIARKTYGIGVAYLYGPELNSIDILKNTLINSDQKDEIINIFNQMKNRPLHKIDKELQQADRKKLDSIIFDILGLTKNENDAIYEELITLVTNRLKKAKNFEK